MKIIETKGINYIEHLAEKSDWYCGNDFKNGDLYEAEESFLETGKCMANRVIFIHQPEGSLVEPIVLTGNQYLGRPTEIDGRIYMLLVDFDRGEAKVIDCGEDFTELQDVCVVALDTLEDCYNLQLHGKKLMLTRQGNDIFQVIWPEKISFPIGGSEAFLYRKGDQFFFSRWLEDPDYLEEVVVRDRVGNIEEIISGNIFITPSGEEWVLN